MVEHVVNKRGIVENDGVPVLEERETCIKTKIMYEEKVARSHFTIDIDKLGN